MSTKKTGYARYTFAFASDIQKLADEKCVKVLSFSTHESNSRQKGSYDVLTVKFLVARPDRNVVAADTQDETLNNDLDNEIEKEEVNNDDIY